MCDEKFFGKNSPTNTAFPQQVFKKNFVENFRIKKFLPLSPHSHIKGEELHVDGVAQTLCGEGQIVANVSGVVDAHIVVAHQLHRVVEVEGVVETELRYPNIAARE